MTSLVCTSKNSIRLWLLVATINFSPFTGEWFTDFLFIHGLFSEVGRLVLSIQIFTWQSRANASLIRSTHENIFTPLTRKVATKLGNDNQPEVFLHKGCLRPPRVMDVRAFGSRTSAQKTFSCAPSDGVKVFGSGRPPGYPPGRPRDVPPKNFVFRLLFHS